MNADLLPPPRGVGGGTTIGHRYKFAPYPLRFNSVMNKAARYLLIPGYMLAFVSSEIDVLKCVYWRTEVRCLRTNGTQAVNMDLSVFRPTYTLNSLRSLFTKTFCIGICMPNIYHTCT